MKTNTESTDTRKHRTPEEMKVLEKKIVAAINREEPLKSIAHSSGCSKTQAYHIAKRLTYGQMIVSEAERESIRVTRGTTTKFRRVAA